MVKIYQEQAIQALMMELSTYSSKKKKNHYRADGEPGNHTAVPLPALEETWPFKLCCKQKGVRTQVSIVHIQHYCAVNLKSEGLPQERRWGTFTSGSF